MATQASAAPSPSPPPASYSGNSAPDPGNSRPNNKVEGAQQNGIFHNEDREPDFADRFDDLGSIDNSERFRKYEADYTSRLMEKYFSRKTIYGGNIFVENEIIGDEIIKASRWPCTRSYADPLSSFEGPTSEESVLTAESFTNISNGKQTVKKGS